MAEIIIQLKHRIKRNVRKIYTLIKKYEGINKTIEDVENERFERVVKKDRIEEFMKVLKNRDRILDEFDGELWNIVIELVKVYTG